MFNSKTSEAPSPRCFIETRPDIEVWCLRDSPLVSWIFSHISFSWKTNEIATGLSKSVARRTNDLTYCFRSHININICLRNFGYVSLFCLEKVMINVSIGYVCLWRLIVSVIVIKRKSSRSISVMSQNTALADYILEAQFQNGQCHLKNIDKIGLELWFFKTNTK